MGVVLARAGRRGRTVVWGLIALVLEDILFTARGSGTGLSWVGYIAYDAVEAVEAPDPRPVRITGKRPFVDADTMVSFPYLT